MPAYLVYGKVEIPVYTRVEANSPEEAIEIAEDRYYRDSLIPAAENSHWVSGCEEGEVYAEEAVLEEDEDSEEEDND